LKHSFQPNTFDFLINTRHIDPDNNLGYIIKKIRRHGQRIAVDRQILGTSPLKSISLDSINALDALILTLHSDPQLQIPPIFDDLKSIFAHTNAHAGGYNTKDSAHAGGYNTKDPAQHSRKRAKKPSCIDREIDRKDRRRSK
jgi:hypothetical protein